MKKVLKIGSAFIGIIVGAGLASGQEILQYFTSFGLWGIAGAVVTTALFAYVGMMLVWLGSRSKKPSHKEVIYGISGRFLGLIIDYIIIFTLFGVGVVMIAGAGSNLNQQFGIPVFIGTTLLGILIILTGMLKINRVVSIISSITPFLIIFVVIVSIYSFVTMDGTFAGLDSIAKGHDTSLPNWFISAINYVSFNTAVGASMAIVTGTAEMDRKTAALGGLTGGIGLGLIILFSHLAIFAKIEEVGSKQLPTLAIVNDISPFLGVLMSVVLFAMIFNTGISMFYSFSTRFTEPGTKRFKIFFTITVIVGYFLSFVGFTDLVSSLYPFIGYLGLVLILVLIAAPFKIRKETN
ncbi:Uncharacterized membrane protein YkvI [Lentibacillus persicus]|uniref:Uncharacterized membrane protein YkvI n=1 Tax=Lentibacillus persicus TaxID=640948 RepID=A0A1I1Y7G4_9BACI|nr:hypothetical protein [Lentibacillus persicus]SFE15547.1 Uncharacterized membrane protein YkvI [Lentibacillus persicus]